MCVYCIVAEAQGLSTLVVFVATLRMHQLLHCYLTFLCIFPFVCVCVFPFICFCVQSFRFVLFMGFEVQGFKVNNNNNKQKNWENELLFYLCW